MGRLACRLKGYFKEVDVILYLGIFFGFKIQLNKFFQNSVLGLFLFINLMV